MANQIDVDVSRRVNASPDAVWAVVADLDRLPDWNQFAAAVEDVSGPAQPGATYTVKPHKPYEPTTHWTVTEPSLRRASCTPARCRRQRRALALEVSAADGGSNVRVHWTGTPKGVMGKLMRSMMQKRITQNWERSLEALDRVASG